MLAVIGMVPWSLVGCSVGTEIGCRVCLLALLRAGCVSLFGEREEGERQSKLGGACMGEVAEEDEFGSMLTKLYVVGVPLLALAVALIGLRIWLASSESDALRFVPSFVSFCGPLAGFSSSSSTLCTAFLDFAIGSARPRNFPRLATPTPQVSWVL